MEASNNEVLAVLELPNKNFNLVLGKYFVGREEICDICIDDPTVEKRHAVVVVQSHGVKIIDLFTNTGTSIDDENICNGKFNDIVKSVPVRFGSVDAQFRIIEDSDSGFLGFISKDASDIIPLSPQECTTERYHSQMGRSRIRSNRTDSQNEFRPPKSPATTFPRDKVYNDIFANVTDANIRRNIEELAEEDDYYVPETQEIFEKRVPSPKLENTNEDVFRITTQEFEDDEKISDSCNLISTENSSMVIPVIRHSPVVVSKIKDEIPLGDCNTAINHPKSDHATVGVKSNNNETECEMSMLNWNDSNNSNLNKENKPEQSNCADLNSRDASVTPDLEELRTEDQNRDGSVTPDLELDKIRSASTTPDLFPASETAVSINIEDHCFSPTQTFHPKKKGSTNNQPVTNANDSPLSNKTACSDLDGTMPFVVGQNINSSRKSNSQKKDDAVFAKPLPIRTKTNNIASEDEDDAEPTQPFILKVKPSTSKTNVAVDDDEDGDFDKFAATQRFNFKRESSISISPAPLLSSDEEMDSEFCFRETIEMDELERSKAKAAESSTSSNSKGRKSRKRKIVSMPNKAKDESLFADIQPTPSMGNIRLPNKNAIENIGKLLGDNSTDDETNSDENSVFKRNDSKKSHENANKGENISKISERKKTVVRVKRILKSDDCQLKKSSKDSLSDISGSSDKRTKTGTEKNINKDPESENVLTEIPTKRRVRKLYSEPGKEEIHEIPNKRTRKPTTKTKDPPKTKSKGADLKLEKNSVGEETKSVGGDLATARVDNLRCRTSKRIKSTPCYMVDEFFLESDFKNFDQDYSKRSSRSNKKKRVPENTKSEDTSKIDLKIKNKSESDDTKNASGDSAEVSTGKPTRRIRRKSVTKPDEISRASCGETEGRKSGSMQKSEMLQKRNSNSSLGEMEENSKSKSAKVSNTEKVMFYTSTPSIRKSNRQVKHRICLTRVDSSPYQKIIEHTGCTIEKDPQSSTVLVAAKITRTWKMLAAIAKGLPIVSIEWFNIVKSNYNQSFSYDDYIIKDPKAERQYKFNLKKSLQAARKKPIFKNLTFYITPQIQPAPVEMTKIIESGEGKVLRKFPSDVQDLSDFYIISCREDRSLWPKFRRAIKDVSIYSTEAVMLAVMQQCINFKPHQLS